MFLSLFRLMKFKNQGEGKLITKVIRVDWFSYLQFTKVIRWEQFATV